MPEPPIRSLTSFDPRFADLLLRGGRERFTLSCENPGQAYRLQMRIQQFRKRAVEAKVENAERFYDCVISLNRKAALLTFMPRREEFGKVLDSVATSQSTLASDPLAALEQPTETNHD